MADKQQSTVDADYELVASPTGSARLKRAVTWVVVLSWLGMLGWLVMLNQPTPAVTPTPATALSDVIEPAPLEDGVLVENATRAANTSALVEAQAFAEQAISDATTTDVTVNVTNTTRDESALSLNALLAITLDIRNRLEQGLGIAHDLVMLARLTREDVLLHNTTKQLRTLVLQEQHSHASLAARLQTLSVVTPYTATDWWARIQDALSSVVSVRKLDGQHTNLVAARAAWKQYQLATAITALENLDDTSEEIDAWLVDAAHYQEQTALLQHIIERVVALSSAPDGMTIEPAVKIAPVVVTPPVRSRKLAPTPATPTPQPSPTPAAPAPEADAPPALPVIAPTLDTPSAPTPPALPSAPAQSGAQ